jgi:hypothetical protein
LTKRLETFKFPVSEPTHATRTSVIICLIYATKEYRKKMRMLSIRDK